MAVLPVAMKGFSAVVCKSVVPNQLAARARVNHVKDRMLIIDRGQKKWAATGSQLVGSGARGTDIREAPTPDPLTHWLLYAGFDRRCTEEVSGVVEQITWATFEISKLGARISCPKNPGAPENL